MNVITNLFERGFPYFFGFGLTFFAFMILYVTVLGKNFG